MVVPIENPAECEVRGVIRSLQIDDILVILPKEALRGIVLLHAVASRDEINGCAAPVFRQLESNPSPGAA